MYYFGQWWVGCLTTVCWMEASGLLHGNQHQASPWQGHTRLTKGKAHRKFQMNHRRSRQVEQACVKLCLLLNLGLLKTHIHWDYQNALPRFPKCSVQWFPGEGRALHHLFFIAWMFTLRKLFLYITLILKDYSSLLPPGSLFSTLKRLASVYIFILSPKAFLL